MDCGRRCRRDAIYQLDKPDRVLGNFMRTPEVVFDIHMLARLRLINTGLHNLQTMCGSAGPTCYWQ
jgi:hypothetical protein